MQAVIGEYAQGRLSAGQAVSLLGCLLPPKGPAPALAPDKAAPELLVAAAALLSSRAQLAPAPTQQDPSSIWGRPAESFAAAQALPQLGVEAGGWGGDNRALSAASWGGSIW